MNSFEQKLMAYVGFGIKARKIRLGSEQILACHDAKVILLTKSLSPSAAEKLESFAKSKNIACHIVSEENLSQLFAQKNVKVVALTDENLASAINKIAK